MKRAIARIGLLLGLGACVAGSWVAIRPPLAPFLAPGATELQVTNLGFWEQHITYRAPGLPYAWFWGVTHALEEQQWKLRTPLRPDLAGPSYDPIMPLRFERATFNFLIEEVALVPDQRDPNLVRIRVNRRIVVPWGL